MKPRRSQYVVARVTKDERRAIVAQQRPDESFSDAVRRLLLRRRSPDAPHTPHLRTEPDE